MDIFHEAERTYEDQKEEEFSCWRMSMNRGIIPIDMYVCNIDDRILDNR